ncbi:SCO3242 family prenyltransferase, partial [Streptomyces lunaelactis]|uniref:SCO3242 family prenyltransferase n=1 Tax=Streptomyces lunaelactis TaxID=1535768 RepID=UPI002815891E
MTLRAWAELLRVSALFTVPGDALAGAATLGTRPNRGTALAVGASLCLYEAGVALNDWVDREEDAGDRPHRPIPSGRITPTAAITAAGALTVAGLALASRAGRPALAVATALSAAVWSYDLHFKHTPGGPAAMATARGLDLVLGAVATGTPPRRESLGRGTSGEPRRAAGARGPAFTALPSAALLAAHTYAVTTVSRREAQGGSTLAPLAALAATIALGALASRPPRGGGLPPTRRSRIAAQPGRGGGGESLQRSAGPPALRAALTPGRLATAALTAAYVRTAAKPLFH